MRTNFNLLICLMAHMLSPVSLVKTEEVHFYDYQTRVQVFASGNRTWPTNFTLSSNLALKIAQTTDSNVHLIKLKFLEMDFTEAVSFGFTAKTLKAIQENIFSFEWDNVNYRVVGIYFSNKETSGSILFKKGVVDLFNANLNSIKEVIFAMFAATYSFYSIYSLLFSKAFWANVKSNTKLCATILKSFKLRNHCEIVCDKR
jgi:hypothetical protein